MHALKPTGYPVKDDSRFHGMIARIGANPLYEHGIMDSAQIERWADAYVELQASPNRTDINHPLAWAGFDALFAFDLPAHDVWKFIVGVVERTSDERVIGILAAGPLEDFISKHGRQYIEAIEAQAKMNPRFKLAIDGVWQNQAPIDVWSRIKAIQQL